jgi:hypothetical protein
MRSFKTTDFYINVNNGIVIRKYVIEEIFFEIDLSENNKKKISKKFSRD